MRVVEWIFFAKPYVSVKSKDQGKEVLGYIVGGGKAGVGVEKGGLDVGVRDSICLFTL